MNWRDTNRLSCPPLWITLWVSPALTTLAGWGIVSSFGDSSRNHPFRPRARHGQVTGQDLQSRLHRIIDHEAYIPAQSPQAEARSRFPQAHEHARWTARHQASSSEGSQAPDGVAHPATESGATMGPQESARSSRRRLRTLEQAWQFRRCYDAGRKLVANHTVIFLFAAPESDGPRIGVVASRKVGGAVKRNRAKRLLREASRQLESSWPDGHWVVLVAKRSIIGRSSEDVRADIERALISGNGVRNGS